MSQIRYLIDEDTPHAIRDGLLLRQPEIEIRVVGGDMAPPYKYYQLDGAEVFVKKIGRGKGYDIVIKGAGGVVTVIHADTRRALSNLARNYNWQTGHVSQLW